MSDKQPINTHVRLFDLVRQQRVELHEQNLISDEEYAWLSGGPMAISPKGGSPSVERLEDYDQMRSKLAVLETELQTTRLDLTRAALWAANLKICLGTFKSTLRDFVQGVHPTKWESKEPRVIGFGLEFDRLKELLARADPEPFPRSAIEETKA